MFVKIVRGGDPKAAWYNKAINNVFEVCKSVHSPTQYVLIDDVIEPSASGRYVPKDLCEIVELGTDNDEKIQNLEEELDEKNEELDEKNEELDEKNEELDEKNVALAREVETNRLLSNKIEKYPQEKEANTAIKSGYEPLHEVLMKALNQAQAGKGDERHAAGRDFIDQPIISIPRLLQSDNGLVYQVIKKMQESERMDRDAAIRERLGAINYIAASILYQQDRTDCAIPTSFDGPRQSTIDILKRSCDDCVHHSGHDDCITCGPCRSNWKG